MLRGAGEGPGVDPNRGHDRATEEAPDRLAGAADGADTRERVEVGLGVAEVADGSHDLAALDEEGPVAGHAGDDHELRVERVRVVEPRHEEAGFEATAE